MCWSFSADADADVTINWCVKIPNHFQVLLAPTRALPNVGKEVVPIQM